MCLHSYSCNVCQRYFRDEKPGEAAEMAAAKAVIPRKAPGTLFAVSQTGKPGRPGALASSLAKEGWIWGYLKELPAQGVNV